MSEKPKIGIMAIAKKNQYRGEICKFVETYKNKLSKEDSLELMMEENVLFNEHDVVKRAKKMEEDGVDLIIFVVGSWIYSSIVISAANDLKTPFILYLSLIHI